MMRLGHRYVASSYRRRRFLPDASVNQLAIVVQLLVFRIRRIDPVSATSSLFAHLGLVFSVHVALALVVTCAYQAPYDRAEWCAAEDEDEGVEEHVVGAMLGAFGV